MIMTNGKEEVEAMSEGSGSRLPLDGQSPRLKRPALQDKVDSIIEHWLTDMWLLITGEELGEIPLCALERDGHACAMVCGGQLRLLDSKLSVLKALGSVGIKMP